MPISTEGVKPRGPDQHGELKMLTFLKTAHLVAKLFQAQPSEPSSLFLFVCFFITINAVVELCGTVTLK